MLFITKEGVGGMYEKIELLIRRMRGKIRRNWFMRCFANCVFNKIIFFEKEIWIDDWEEERE